MKPTSDYLHYRIVEAAREWLEDRVPHSQTEKQLMVTLYDAYPEDFTVKEGCACEEKGECEECLCATELRAAIDRMRDECREPFRDPASGLAFHDAPATP